MKIIKSFTDENGQEVLVQGAGTDYNPELNSFAIGEGTVTAGEDQFVFGRYNEQDSDKAEIVGGGQPFIIKEEVELGVTDIQGLYNSLILPPYIACGSTKQSFYGGKNLTEVKESFIKYFGEQLNKDEIYITSKNIFEECDFFIFTKDKPSSATRYYLYGYNSTQDTWYVSHALVFNGTWGVSNTNPNYTKFFGIIELPKDPVWSLSTVPEKDKNGDPVSTPNLVTQSDRITFLNKLKNFIAPTNKLSNIRTLDWEGNEYIANSLAIGKDSKSDTNGQLVFGRGNKLDNTKVEIVGNGAEDGIITYDLTDVESIKNIPIGTELHTDIQATDWYKNATLIVVANTLEELNELGTDTINLGFSEQQGLDDIDIYLYCKYKNLDAAKTHRYAYIFKRKDEEQIRIKFTTMYNTNNRFWFDEPLSDGMLFNSIQSNHSSDEVIRTLDWEGNEVLAGELTSKKVNTKSVKWEDDTYSRQIDAQEASLMPKIVETSSQTVKVTNPITQNKLDIQIPNISEIGMLAKSNKFLKLVVNEESIKTIWGQQQLTNSTITFRNVKTTLIDNVFYETIIEIIYALDLPTASVMHKVADLQTGDIQYYLATSLS